MVSALVWGLAWGVAGLALGLVIAMIRPPLVSEGPRGVELVALCGVLFATLGGTAGALFAVAVVVLIRFRPRARLSPWLAALLGALASAVAALQATDRIGEIASVAALGAALAAGSVSIAQRSRRQTQGSRPEAAT